MTSVPSPPGDILSYKIMSSIQHYNTIRILTISTSETGVCLSMLSTGQWILLFTKTTMKSRLDFFSTKALYVSIYKNSRAGHIFNKEALVWPKLC